MAQPPAGAIRIDRWLWHARLFRSRSLAARAVAAGAVRVNGVRVLRPATPVRPGDGVTLAQGAWVRVLRVRALGARRGPAAEASGLFDDLAPVEDAVRRRSPGLPPGRA